MKQSFFEEGDYVITTTEIPWYTRKFKKNEANGEPTGENVDKFLREFYATYEIEGARYPIVESLGYVPMLVNAKLIENKTNQTLVEVAHE